MIKIITDSAADLPEREAREYQIRVMPIPITVDGVTYRESVDFTSEEYYEMLTAAKSIPTTAQITPAKLSREIKIPRPVISSRGFVLRLVTPSAASPSIFFSG